MPIAGFLYNYARNTSTNRIPFELNSNFYLRVLLEEIVDFHSKSFFAKKQADKLGELIEICYHNQIYAQKL